MRKNITQLVQRIIEIKVSSILHLENEFITHKKFSLVSNMIA